MLDLSQNQISDNSASGLVSDLGNCKKISTLTLNLRYKIGYEGKSGLGSGLGKWTNLSNLTLYLQENKIGDAGALGLGQESSVISHIWHLIQTKSLSNQNNSKQSASNQKIQQSQKRSDTNCEKTRKIYKNI
ncbi:hypothetical protein TTHERM_001248861 (macronuclear) [Tetrahymena thermophila SB210]|uniref:Kinase domain protein n=1 Tax=Tetrahymena thermophila (strain SB210) TaxID=312017 RepID=W7WZZ6_TETTS|nr:hypothetical protein TTHERM_001248861 [Tetrahymena thermophila SB210]EWS72430.1 hypothetical protein TTHERM_001248861 [Tetrahymena thermophila SB210]|eukprot:XP_012655032.1 hypothetical protein TTHERM_001248861 [Tetrahymena thermophila SB210]